MRYYNYLASLYLTLILATVVVAYKTLEFGTFLFPGGIFIYPLNYFLGSVIAEIYGFKMSKQLIYASLLAQFVFAITLTLINELPSPSFWHHQAAYDQVIDPLIRCVISISVGTTIGAILNSYAISKWKVLLKGKHFWLRSIGANIVGESALSLITFSMAFIGTMPSASLLNLIFYSWLLKAVYAIALSGFGAFLVAFLKSKERFDIKNENLNFLVK